MTPERSDRAPRTAPADGPYKCVQMGGFPVHGPLGRVAIGIAASGAIHAGILYALSRTHAGVTAHAEPEAFSLLDGVGLTPEPSPPAEEEKPESAPPEMPPEMPQPEVRLGLEDGSEKGKAWQGHTEATPHGGIRSEVEQAALARSVGVENSGAGGANAARPAMDAAKPAAEPEKDPELTAKPEPAEPNAVKTPEVAEVKPAPVIADPEPVKTIGAPVEAEEATEKAETTETNPATTPEPVVPEEDPTGLMEPAPVPVPEVVAEEVVQAVEPVVSVRPRRSEVQRMVEQAAAMFAGLPAPPGDQGERSESESVATSIANSVAVEPGRVLSAKGLRINTVRPRLSTTTLLSTRPKSVYVKTVFGRSGKVIRAEFLPGHSTGYSSWDGPLLDAVYKWTARGEELRKLPEGPEAREREPGVELTFKIILSDD